MRELSCKVHRRALIPELKVSIRVLETHGDKVRIGLTAPAGLRIARQQSLLCRAVGAVRDVK
jgi:sRNA-binding carbon storage regulator CsrA